jgi:hypothetical protein
LTLIGIALIIAALAGAYYLLKRTPRSAPSAQLVGEDHGSGPIQTA